MPQIDLTQVKPYGDTLDDGAMQLSFTLPIPTDEVAEEAAKRLVELIGFEESMVTSMQDLGDGYTFFVMYVRTKQSIDVSRIVVPKVDSPSYDYYEINEIIQSKLKRKLVVVGACTGSDAHTVGIDAIMNMKGYNHHYGLERYPEIDALNMGSQIPNDTLLKTAMQKQADAVLVSQVVTQKEAHIANLTEFIELAESYGVREKMLMIVGGPRISHQLAIELGFDAGFGPGTFAEDVASYILQSRLKKEGITFGNESP